MSEKKQLPPKPEGPVGDSSRTLGEIEAERGYEDTHYHSIADLFITNHVGEVPAEDRDFLRNAVADEVRNVLTTDFRGAAAGEDYDKFVADRKEADGDNFDEDSIKDLYANHRKTKALESLILKLRAENEQGNENEPQPVPVEKKRNILMRALIGANRMTGAAILSVSSWVSEKRAKSANKYKQQPGETDEDYDKRKRKIGFRANLAVAAIGGAFLAYSISKGIDLDSFSNGGSAGVNPEDGQPKGRPIEGDTNGGDTLDTNELLALKEQSYQEETDFLRTNGRQGNDFNDISGDKLKNTTHTEYFDGNEIHPTPPGFDALMDQYNASPRTLAAQMDQFRDAGIEFPEELSELRRQPGEEYTAYIDRITEEMHKNEKLHGDAVQFAADQLIDKKAAPLEGPYRSAYIVEDGEGNFQVYWDERVESPDPNDQIIMIDDKRGIRLPCGQPIELLPQEAAVPGAPAVTYRGVGNGPVGETPFTPGTPGNPGEGTPPGTGGENPPPEETTPPEQETTPPETLAPKSENPDDYEHIEDAPPAEFDGWAPPAQTEPTPPSVVDQQPGSEIGYDEPASQAPDAQPVTPEENQQRENTPPAEGATTPDNPGTETENPF